MTHDTFGFIYDFDLTLTKKFQQEPLLEEYFPQLQRIYPPLKEVLDYFSLCDDADISVGYLNQMLKDAEILGGLGNERLRTEFGPKIVLADGIPQWFMHINEYCASKNKKAEHHALSLGLRPLIEGTAILPYLSSLQAAEFIEENGRVTKIKNAIPPFRKVEYIKPICKGASLHQDVAIKNYHIRYSNCFVFGDGQSDKDMFRFIKQRGGMAIAVYEPGNRQQYDTLRIHLEDSVNCILPRDYSADSEIARIVRESINLRIRSECNMDYEIVHKMRLEHLENPEIITLAQTHLAGCALCKDRGFTRSHFK